MILLGFRKQIESLQELISDGIIDPSEGEQKIYMLKETAVLKVHDRAINTRSNGRYITKAKLDGTLSQISAYTYEELIEKLYKFYYGEANSTLESLYPQWVDFRRSETSATEKTIKEDGYLWNAHLKGQDITRKPLRKLKVKDFNAFFRKLTKDRTITKKRFNNMKSIINGIYYYAIEKEIVDYNPLDGINYGQYSYKAENNDIIPFTEEERLKVIEYLSEDNLYDLAIKLSFQLTIRIGELKGLRFDDIDGNYINVCRFVNDKHEVINDIKGHTSAGKRWLPLTPDAKHVIECIKELNPNSKYLFMDDLENQKFITTVTFNRHLKKCCSALGIKYRPSHKIRFTNASILSKNGVSNTELQKMLGHSTLNTTNHYIRNVNSLNETYEKVANIFA